MSDLWRRTIWFMNYQGRMIAVPKRGALQRRDAGFRPWEPCEVCAQWGCIGQCFG